MQKEYDVIVVGAGPAGSVAARFAAEKGVSVLMLEKDRDIGYPVRCAEAATMGSIEAFIEPDPKWIATVINRFSLNSPDGKRVEIDFDDAGYVLERRIFDVELAKLAAKEGTDILTRAYVYDLLKENGTVSGVKVEYKGEQHTIKSKVVIAADGVESRVGRWAGIETHIDYRDMECCAQVTATNIDVDPATIYFYFGREVAPFGYLWVFPKGKNSANIGLGVGGHIGKTKSAQQYLDEFLERKYPNASIISAVAGGVPCSITLSQISAPGIVITGDAARQVNPLSGGGITSGMRGGRIAGTIAADSILNNDPGHLLTYDKQWHEALGKKHETFNRLKNGIYNFSDEKFNSIAAAFGKVPENKKTLGNLFRTALFNNPSLLYDVAKVFLK